MKITFSELGSITRSQNRSSSKKPSSKKPSKVSVINISVGK